MMPETKQAPKPMKDRKVVGVKCTFFMPAYIVVCPDCGTDHELTTSDANRITKHLRGRAPMPKAMCRGCDNALGINEIEKGVMDFRSKKKTDEEIHRLQAQIRGLNAQVDSLQEDLAGAENDLRGVQAEFHDAQDAHRDFLANVADQIQAEEGGY